MTRKLWLLCLLVIVLLLQSSSVIAAPAAMDATNSQSIPFLVAQHGSAGTSWNLSLRILAVMTLLTVLPALLVTLSAFTRIIIVLAIVRQAIGIPNVPGNQVLIGLALIMTLYVMTPVLEKMNTTALQPWLAKQVTDQVALEKSINLLRTFMLKQTRKQDLAMFVNLAHARPDANGQYSMLVLMPSYITSELKTAFEIGFLIFLPFLIIDIVIASILMSMGMMMLSPMVISLPFKILFFVLVSGWDLIVTSLISSFRM